MCDAFSLCFESDLHETVFITLVVSLFTVIAIAKIKTNE